MNIFKLSKEDFEKYIKNEFKNISAEELEKELIECGLEANNDK